MSEADETTTQQIAALRSSSRAKYASGTERLQRGDDALALLSFHGALEDGLWAYLLEQGQSLGAWPTVLDALRADPVHPLSDEDVLLLRSNNALRNRIAHGEAIVLREGDVAVYEEAAWELLSAYGVSLIQRETEQVAPSAQETPRRVEQTPLEETGDTRPPRARRDFLPRDLGEWREQAATQVERNRQLLIPIALGLVVVLLLCLLLRTFFGGSTTPQTAQQNERPTIGLAEVTIDPTGPPTVGTSLANEQAAILPTAGTDATAIPGDQNVPPAQNAPATGGLVAGGQAVVTEQGDQVNVRTEPGTGPNSSVIASLTAGTSLQVLEGPVQSEGYTWWRIRAGTTEGWCVGDFLAAAAGP